MSIVNEQVIYLHICKRRESKQSVTLLYRNKQAEQRAEKHRASKNKLSALCFDLISSLLCKRRLSALCALFLCSLRSVLCALCSVLSALVSVICIIALCSALRSAPSLIIASKQREQASREARLICSLSRSLLASLLSVLA